MTRRAQLTRSGHSRVILLTRWPAPGRVKTRLIPALGAAGAAELHRALTEHVAREVLALGATGEATIEVRHAGGTSRALRRWLGSLPRYRAQPAGLDLGGQLRLAFAEAFSSGARRCVVVGSDCPAVGADHLRRALAALARAELVLGPAADGGYWLIGLRAEANERAGELFEGVSWGSDAVLRETLERAARRQLEPALLEELADVDRPEDLAGWERERDAPAGALRLSVVIPTLDEEALIAGAVERAREAGVDEVLVADGGSRDRTRELAARAGAEVLETPRGRARQLNAGAARASGDALLFLHADTTLPAGAGALIRRALGRAGTVAGAFAYRAAARGLLGHLLTVGNGVRYRLSGHPYGDQGLFLRRRTFRALGGFPELPVMEDWELVARLRRLGRVVVLPQAAITSAASFTDAGLVRACVVNVAVIVGYQLGLDPGQLAGWRARVARRGA